MHRDYFETGHNNIIRIFPNELTITNVWLKPKWFKIGKDTFRRNKIIADLFSRISFIEKIGSGLARMEHFCKEVRAPLFKLDLDEKYFRIIFFKGKAYLELVEKVGEKVGIKVGENENKILNLIHQNKYITYLELAGQLKISEKSIFKNVDKLKKKGILKRIGPAKGGYWEIISK